MNTMYGDPRSGMYAQPMGSGYPVDIQFPQQETYKKFWAIPLVGIAVKYIILIPHFIALAILGFVLALLHMVIWIPVLMTGQYPEWGYNVTAGYIRWFARVMSFLYGLSDTYPAFSLQDTSSDTQVMLPVPTNCNKFWAIPFIGYFAKLILLIPHIIVLYIIGLIVNLIQLVAWIPVFTTGQYPDWARMFVGGYIRWQIRISAFLFGLTDKYPPFQLSA